MFTRHVFICWNLCGYWNGNLYHLHGLAFRKYGFLLQLCLRASVHYALLSSLPCSFSVVKFGQSTYLRVRPCLWSPHGQGTNRLSRWEGGRREHTLGGSSYSRRDGPCPAVDAGSAIWMDSSLGYSHNGEGSEHDLSIRHCTGPVASQGVTEHCHSPLRCSLFLVRSMWPDRRKAIDTGSQDKCSEMCLRSN